MSFRLSNIHDYNRFIVVDLGSYRVRACIYEREEWWTLILQWKASVRQNRKNFLDGSITNLRGVADTIERAILQAGNTLDTIPDDIIISFSPELTIFDSMTTQYVRSDREAPITMDEIDTMIKKIEYQSLERAKEKSKKQYGMIHDDVRLLSSTMTSIQIDGKHVTNPLGFSGSNILIRVLNVFAPSSEFNILRSILSSLGKRTISLVPTPLLFSKIAEQSDYALEYNVYIDLGYLHTTIVFESRNEINAFETFSFWAKNLLDVFATKLADKTYFEIEHMLWSTDSAFWTDEVSVLEEFFEYLIDILSVLISREKFSIQNIFLSWGIFQNTAYRDLFFEQFSAIYKHDFRMLELAKIAEKKLEPDYVLCYGLAILAEELLVTKKDPLIRLLRYVLYNYE